MQLVLVFSVANLAECLDHGAKKISLVNQLGSIFSYCFGPIRDPHYIHNQLIFGDGAIIEGPSMILVASTL